MMSTDPTANRVPPRVSSRASVPSSRTEKGAGPGGESEPGSWCGGEEPSHGGEESVRELAHRLGAPVVTTYAGRGLLAGDPLLVNAPVHEPEVSAVLADADLLIVLGSSFDGMNTKNWKIPLPDRRAAVTLGSLIDQTVDFDCMIKADVDLTLTDLRDALDEMDISPRTPWRDVTDISNTRWFCLFLAPLRIAGSRSLHGGAGMAAASH